MTNLSRRTLPAATTSPGRGADRAARCVPRRVAAPCALADDGGMWTRGILRWAAVMAAAAALAGCGRAAEPTPPPDSSPAASTPPAAPAAATDAELERCRSVLREQTVQGLLGGQPEVTGGKQRVTGQVTQTRCTWFAPNGRYITIVSLDGPGLSARARTVEAGAEPVTGSPGVSYDVARGLIVTVDERLHQIVAGGAGTAQARIIGLKAVDAIRSGG